SRPLPASGRTPPLRYRSTGGNPDAAAVALSPGSVPHEVGEGTAAGARRSRAKRGGRGKPSESGETRLAPLAPPPGLRPYSPAPLPLHGGEILMPTKWGKGQTSVSRRVWRPTSPRPADRRGLPV